MKRNSTALRRQAGAAAAVIIAVGLMLAGCGGSGGSSSNSSAGSSAGSGSGSSAGPSSSSSSSYGSGSTPVVSSASVPFPIAVGNTWVYKTTEATLGTTGTSTNKIVSVTPVSGGQKVTMSTANDIEGTITTSTGYYIFHSDGSISYPFSQFNTGSSTAQVKLVSGTIFWPPASELASGQAYHSTLQIVYTVAGTQHNVTAHVTVQSAGTATVTVPAGTYSATIVNMTMAETVEGYAISIGVKTWLASGVGPVQSEASVDEAGASHVVSEQQMTSFTKG